MDSPNPPQPGVSYIQNRISEDCSQLHLGTSLVAALDRSVIGAFVPCSYYIMDGWYSEGRGL